MKARRDYCKFEEKKKIEHMKAYRCINEIGCEESCETSQLVFFSSSLRCEG